MLSRMLAGEGWSVSEAENGRDGLDRIAEARPDLIMLDLVMPDAPHRATRRACPRSRFASIK